MLHQTFHAYTHYLKWVYLILSMVTIFLSVHQKRSMWVINLTRKSLGFYIYYMVGLYVKCTLDVMLLVKSFYGWVNWGTKPNKGSLSPTFLRPMYLLLLVMVVPLATFPLGLLYASYTASKLPYFDAAHAVLVLLTYGLMAQKKIETWPCWIIANLIYIYTTWRLDEYLIVIKYVTYIPFGIYGFYQWYGDYREVAARKDGSSSH